MSTATDPGSGAVLRQLPATEGVRDWLAVTLLRPVRRRRPRDRDAVVADPRGDRPPGPAGSPAAVRRRW
jgi:hypothetical protein